MKKIFEKIAILIKENRMLFLWILLFFLIGIVLGSYTVYYMGDYSKLEMGSYFSSFLEFMKAQDINYKEILFNSIKSVIPMAVIIILLGYTLIGFPFVLLVNLVKGYVLGFSLSTIITVLGSKGAGVVFSTIIIQNLILIPMIILISIIAMRNSLIKLKSLRKDFKGISQNNGEYTIIQLVLLIIIPIGIVVETYISPNLLKLVIK